MTNTKNKLQNYNFGLSAEKIAIIWLTLKGYKIIAHRYRNKLGEIDIIAQKFKTIIFIEVKARKNFDKIEEVLSSYQINRIKNSAELFINSNTHLQNLNYRYDFIAVKNFLKIKHFINFFNFD